MDKTFLAILLITIFAAIFAAAFYLRYRQRTLPYKQVARPLTDSLFEIRTPEQTIWKLTEFEPQPLDSVECVAYTWREILQTLGGAINGKMPTVSEVFALLGGKSTGLDSRRAIRKLRSLGIVKSYFQFDSLDQIKQFLRDYAPCPAAVLPAHITLSESGEQIEEVEHISTFGGHSVIIFGYNDQIETATGRGAFRVRWHLIPDVWLPYEFAEQLIKRNDTFGFEM